MALGTAWHFGRGQSDADITPSVVTFLLEPFNPPGLVLGIHHDRLGSAKGRLTPPGRSLQKRSAQPGKRASM